MRFTYLICLIFGIQLLNAQAAIPVSLTKVVWCQDSISDGICFGQMQFKDLFESKQSVSVLQLDLSKHIFAKFIYSDTNRNTSEMARDAGALAAINGSFFDMENGGSVQYLKSGGKSINYSKASKYPFWDSGALVIDQNGSAALIRAPKDLDWAVFDQNAQFPDIMVSGPWILFEGISVAIEAVSFNTNRHPRTFVCVDEGKRLKLISVDGRNSEAQGMSIAELQILAQSLECTSALNLDGGGSTTMWIEKYGVVNHPSDNRQFDALGERPCANIIAILAKKLD